MNNKYVAIVAVVAAMLVATTAITGDSAFATKYNGKNQAAAQANSCGNGELPLNVGCQNSASQIQGDENVVTTASDQTFSESEPLGTPVSVPEP